MSKSFGITARFLTAFAALLVVLATTGIFAVVKMGEVNDLSAELRGRWLPASRIIGDIHAYMSQYRIKQTDQAQGTTPAAQERGEKLMRNAQAAIDGMLKDYEPLLASKEQKELFAKLKTDWTQYTSSSKTIVDQVRTDPALAIDALNGENLDAFYTVEDDILQLIDLNAKGATDISKKSEAIYASARNFMFGAIGAGLLIAVGLLLFLMRTIAQPIRTMSEAVRRLIEGDMSVDVPGRNRGDEIGSLARALERFKDLFAADQERARAEVERAREAQITIDAIAGGLTALAEGNLTYRVDENGSGALAKLRVDYNEAVRRLSEVLSDIVEGCYTIKAGTNEIASAATDLSRRTERQAEAIAHASRTLSEFSGSIKVAADNARQTSTKLGAAQKSAEDADETAKNAVVAMKTIEASSKEMTDIITTIDSLAFQTNLLALNAGVEAARAGQSGAGFAVVASEVRNLAQRSAQAAQSIRNLVMTSGSQINQGVTLVETSGGALRQIALDVASVSSLVAEIAAAAERQATGISEISGMVSSMDEATQQNAAMVEQSSASTRNLSEETARLVERLGRFRVAGSGDESFTSAASTFSSPAFQSVPQTAGNLAIAYADDDEEWESF